VERPEVPDMNAISEALSDEISGAAFRRLLQTRSPVEAEELGADLGRPPEAIRAALQELDQRGRIRLDGQGNVIGSAGLSVRPDRHQIEIGGWEFWTWCAYDVVGIFGALGATGRARSSSRQSGAPLEVDFRLGRPEPTAVVLFRPDEDYMSCCASVYEEWCPQSNFFETREAAAAWSKAHGLSGGVLALEEATELASKNWEPLVRGLRT
jgi:hypothetical protein